MEGMSAAGLLSAAAWGLSLSTLAFGSLGIHAEKDFFIMMGLISVLLGDVVFAFYMQDQGSQLGTDPSVIVTIFGCLALFALYAIGCQFTLWREEGCPRASEAELEEERLQEEEEERQQQAAAAAARKASSRAKAVPDSSSKALKDD
jgi:hypothetical protein